MDFILFFSFHTVRVEVENKKWKAREKKKRLHVLHAPTLSAKYCFTSHVSACQNEARGISASTQHISPHTHTLVQLKMKEQHKKAPKHILHFITIKAESGGTASAFRLIQELYFFVYPCHDSVTNKTPSAPDHFPPVGRGSVIQLINESVQQSCVSPQSVSGLPEVRMSRRSSCGFSQKVNRVDCHRQNYCVVQCYGKLTSYFGRRIMTLLGCS